MMYITSTNSCVIHEWHIGEDFPVNTENFDVLEIQADSDELEAIRKYFSNIPMSSRLSVRWTGEMAQFIIDNMPRCLLGSD
jgi:hypothetical protein